MAFFVLDKTMRVLNADPDAESTGGHSHSHGHTHAHKPAIDKAGAGSTAKSSATSDPAHAGELRSRKSPSDLATTPATPPGQAQKDEINPSLRLSAYLSMFGDFTHNITDGLAMAASFYSSPALGAVTTLATFAHEIPHEVRDWIQRGAQEALTRRRSQTTPSSSSRASRSARRFRRSSSRPWARS